MKAVQVSQTGGPEVLEYRDVADPVAGPGQAVVDLQASGVNYMDVYLRSGANQPQLPVIPGGEGAGVVTEVGEGVTEVEVGDVVTYTGAGSSYAERVVVPSWRLVKMPEGLDAEVGAAVMLQGMTAHYLCYSTYPLKPGDVCIVHSAAGGVGLLLTQMSKALGATVIATVSTEEKAELARGAGADRVINYAELDFAAEVERITGGEGVQVAYDAVGLATYEGSLASLAPRGMLALYGQASGPVPPINTALLGRKSLFLTRPSLGGYTATREELLQRAGDVLGWVQEGSLDVRIHGRFPLSDASEAHRQLEGRLTTGKLILLP